MKKLFVALLLLGTAHGLQATEETKKERLSELLDLINGEAMIEAIYAQMDGMMRTMSQEMGVQPSEQEIVDAYFTKVTDLVRREMSWEILEPRIIDIYLRNFNEKEIEDMIAFYQTETGQATIQKMPVVMQESMQMSQDALGPIIPKIMELSKELEQELQKARAEESSASSPES